MLYKKIPLWSRPTESELGQSRPNGHQKSLSLKFFTETFTITKVNALTNRMQKVIFRV